MTKAIFCWSDTVNMENTGLIRSVFHSVFVFKPEPAVATNSISNYSNAQFLFKGRLAYNFMTFYVEFIFMETNTQQ